VLDRVRRGLQARLRHAEDAEESDGGAPALAVYRELRREVIDVQNTELHRLYDDHRISDTTRRQLQRDLDLEAAALGAS
jgi:CPA1 family monovalent cation:H+ antiporter